jgi:hypothetical protein
VALRGGGARGGVLRKGGARRSNEGHKDKLME